MLFYFLLHRVKSKEVTISNKLIKITNIYFHKQKIQLKFCCDDFHNDMDGFGVYVILIKVTVKYFWWEKKV